MACKEMTQKEMLKDLELEFRINKLPTREDRKRLRDCLKNVVTAMPNTLNSVHEDERGFFIKMMGVGMHMMYRLAYGIDYKHEMMKDMKDDPEGMIASLRNHFANKDFTRIVKDLVISLR